MPRRTVTRSAPAVSLADVEQAQRQIAGLVHATPLVPAPPWPGAPRAEVHLKLENLQLTGCFKLRGAANKIAHLSPAQARRGVIAASAGNHSQGVAYAGRQRGIPVTIVMAEGASPSKIVATEALGARVVLKGRDYQEAYDEAIRRAASDGLTLIPAYDDPYVIAGQGTVGLEILDALPQVRTIVAGVGGGGLVSGIAVAAKARSPRTRIVAVQPAGSSTLARSLKAGHVVEGGPPETFADGLATRKVGQITFDLMSRYVDEVVEVSEIELAHAVFFLLEKAHVMAEGAGAASVAALLKRPDLLKAGPAVAVVSGGNLDPFLLDRILWSGLATEGRILRVRTALPDRPGALARFLDAVAKAKANVQSIRHDRESPALPPGEAAVEVELEVRDAEQGDEVLQSLRKGGWKIERLSLGVDPRRT